MKESKYGILIVDDESLIRSNLQAYLEDEGYPVLVAASGEEALELLSRDQTRMDVAVVDMRLSRMDGAAAILAIHAMAPHMKYLIHTGSSEYRLSPELRALRLVDDCILHKPLSDMKYLIESIERVMSA